MAIMKWTENQPVQVQLKYASGKRSTSSRYNTVQVMYSLVDGQIMYVPLIVEQKLQELGVKRGEAVEICKAKVDGKVQWDVRRPASKQKSNAQPAAAMVESAPDLSGPDVDAVSEHELEQALRISLVAAKNAEAYSHSIGKPVTFDKNDIRQLAAALVMRRRAA